MNAYIVWRRVSIDPFEDQNSSFIWIFFGFLAKSKEDPKIRWQGIYIRKVRFLAMSELHVIFCDFFSANRM